jgi:sigma-54 dependent transcriptional regulator, acetoin dehydrogenase operon transcriptional activator AcoR
MDDPASSQALTVRAARERFLTTRELPPEVRPEIAASWERSYLSGVIPHRPAAPFLGDFEWKNKLYVAARPVLERYGARLADTKTSIVLADRNARVLGRWMGDKGVLRRLDQSSVAPGFSLLEEAAGTNGLGTALEVGGPIAILGDEHYADVFADLTCVGSPIRHPITRRIEGVVDIACEYRHTNSLLLPMVMEIAEEIERQLYLHASHGERAVLDSFLRALRHSATALVAVNEQMMISNAAAARLLDNADQVVLWEEAASAMSDRGEHERELMLRNGHRVRARFRPVMAGDRSLGAIVEMEPLAEAVARRRRRARERIGADQATTSLVGHSVCWTHVVETARRLSTTKVPILILGEAGAGKLAVARLLHDMAGGKGPFSVLDGALEIVQGSTAWLAELGRRLADPSGTLVITHLQSLESRTAQAACALLDAASGQEWPRLIGTLTCDEAVIPAYGPLGDRLAAATIEVPALRQRPEDIADLVAHFAHRQTSDHAAVPTRFDHDALQSLMRYPWPGNVRLLETMVRGLLATRPGGRVNATDLPDEIRKAAPRRSLSRLERTELDEILGALTEAKGNKQRAAHILGTSRSTLYRRLRAFGVDLDHALV